MENIEWAWIVPTLIIMINTFMATHFLNSRLNSLEERIEGIDKQLNNITPTIFEYNSADLDDIDKNVQRILDILDTQHFEKVEQNLKNLKS